MDSRPTQVRDVTVSGREWSGKGPAWDGPRLAPPLTKQVQVGFVSMCSWRSVGGRQTARWGWVSTNRLRTSIGRFVGDTRAGATAIAAVAVTVMTVGAAALIGDHVWLVDQRDVLKNASDAASVATTLELNRQLNLQPGISDSDLKPLLEPVARRYIELNLEHLPPDRLELAINTLSVEVTLDRSQRTVDVSAAANLGGTLLSKHLTLLGNYSGPELIRAESVTESVTRPIEVVLALDVSQSMWNTLAENRRPWTFTDEQARIDVVKSAAKSLVDILNPNAENRVAVGLVPWSNLVRLDADAIVEWEHNGWARYPTRRVYGVPYVCKGTNCTPPAAIVQDVAPQQPEPWIGCLDGHRMGSTRTSASLPAAGELLVPPSANAFAQGFFQPFAGWAYECLDPPPADLRSQTCRVNATSSRQSIIDDAQYSCWDDSSKMRPYSSWIYPAILPLGTDRAVIERAIDKLDALGTQTYSALGVLWGQRLLQHSWKDVWGGAVHPEDPSETTNQGLRKAIVLLTDGEDTYCGVGNTDCDDSEMGISRSDACDAAKAAGSEIFVVAAMAQALVSTPLARTLRDCSSEADNPDGTYVFVDNSTPQALRAAFADIANQLVTVRKVY